LYNQENFKVIFQKYLDNQCSPEEADWLLAYLKDHPQDELPQQLIEEQVAKKLEEDHRTDPAVRERLEMRLQKILRQIETPVLPIGIRRFRWSRIAAAAAIILAIGTGAYFLVNRNPQKVIAKIQAPVKHDVAAPASTHAIITLANGKQIVLDSAANGTLATQGNINIKKLNDGQIIYTGNATEISYNTLVNPKGSKAVNLTLADGSQVWLNAASSLTYPTAFTGNERKVQITGEAYFEVSHNAAMPFKVTKGDATVTVLGTHFNVNAYEDEGALKVTLLQGSVKVSNNRESVTIKPGEQAEFIDHSPLTIDHSPFTIHQPDLDQVMAWKNGKFDFGEGEDITSVMRQIARWYDVEVEYKGKVTGHLWGTISREANASAVFKMLEMTGSMKFRIEGKKVIVMQ